MARFCHAPWVQVSTRTDGSLSPCCNMGMEKKAYNYDDYKDSESLNKLKEEFKNGIEPEACYICWNEEAAGAASLRQSIEHEVKQTEIQVDLDKIEPPYSIQLNVGQVCNLKCRICHPGSSHLLAKEHNLLVDMGARENKLPPGCNRYMMDPSYSDWIKDNDQNLRHFQLLGGEPFMDAVDEQIELLSSFSHPENIVLTYVTNATIWPPAKIIKLLKTFNRAMLILSVDGIGDVFEYGRFPAKWNEVEENVLRYKKLADQHSNIFVKINNVISIFNVLNLPEFTAWTEQHDLHAPLHLLEYPNHYNIHHMSREVKDYIINVLDPHPKLQKIIPALREDTKSVMTKEFVNELLLLDIVRNQSYRKIYPDDFIKLLKINE